MKNLLAAIDFSDVTHDVIEAAFAQASVARACLKVIHVSAPDPDFVGYGAGPIHEVEYRTKTLTDEKQRLDLIVERLRERGVDAAAAFEEGPTVDVLLQEIKDNNIDLVIVGSHGHGALFNLVVGSVTQALLHRAKIPVMVVPANKD